MRRALLVLRGRPGLGHVTPGLAIARELERRGWESHVLTYDNGARFLQRSQWPSWEALELPPIYQDWPGLTLYDHGLRQVVPRIEAQAADLVLFGGEYMLGMVADLCAAPCGMLFNPEILEDCPRNRVPARLFAHLFGYCEFLIPLRGLQGLRVLNEFQPLLPRLLPAGPFPLTALSPAAQPPEAVLVLIGNGGGVSFPKRTDSYSDAGANPDVWREETRAMTRASAAAALAAVGERGRVHVFSCLEEEWNDALQRELAPRGELRVSGPSMSFYEVLAQADVVVSRAGAGLIADTAETPAEVILWSLSDHAEQAANARAFAAARPRTQAVTGPTELQAAVRRAVGAVRRAPAHRPLVAPAAAAAVLVDELLRRLER